MKALAGILAFAALALVMVSFGCLQKDVIPLGSVEVNDYNGENLSSVNDFRENSIKGVQLVDRNSYSLNVTGLVEEPKNYSYEEAAGGFQNYSKVVTLNCVEGWSAKILWEGVLVRDIINQSRALPSAKTVIFRAHDGYSTSFPIEYIMGNDIIMAYGMNGIEVPPERGFPFVLVAEQKWGYKWIKWITQIELSDDTTYRGYWEQRGYSNTGDLNKRFIGD